MNSSIVTERRYPLSAPERLAEAALLARNAQHFASFVGTRRESYDAMAALTPIARDVVCEPVAEDGISGWWVRPVGALPEKAILFVHGGAYMLGSAQAYRGLASQVAARSNVATFVVDYPLAPEHSFPAAFDAVASARRWLDLQGISQLALVGDSAGGGLALAILNELPEHATPISAVVVFSPWTDLALTGPSFTDPAIHDPIFQPGVVANAARAYLGAADPKDPRASPLYGIAGKLAPLLIQVGMDELLLDDARRYAALASAKGVCVRLDMFEGLHHVFQRAVEDLPTARRALDDAGRFLSEHWAS